MCLSQGHNAGTPVRLEPAAFGLASSSLPLSHSALCYAPGKHIAFGADPVDDGIRLSCVQDNALLTIQN